MPLEEAGRLVGFIEAVSAVVMVVVSVVVVLVVFVYVITYIALDQLAKGAYSWRDGDIDRDIIFNDNRPNFHTRRSDGNHCRNKSDIHHRLHIDS